MKYIYKLIKFKDVSEEDTICADNELSDADKIAFVVGLNSGIVKEEDFLWFGFKLNYSFGTDSESWVIQRIEENFGK